MKVQNTTGGGTGSRVRPLVAFAADTQSALPKFMGRKVTVTDPAPMMVSFPKNRRAFVSKAPSATVLYDARRFWKIARGNDRSGGKGLDVFLSDITISNQSKHEFWNLPQLSNAPVFATADYVWGPDESHYSEHRYLVSTYTRRSSPLLDGLFYYLEDRYMTTRKYGEDSHILNSEKPENPRTPETCKGRDPKTPANTLTQPVYRRVSLTRSESALPLVPELFTPEISHQNRPTSGFYLLCSSESCFVI